MEVRAVSNRPAPPSQQVLAASQPGTAWRVRQNGTHPHSKKSVTPLLKTLHLSELGFRAQNKSVSDKFIAQKLLDYAGREDKLSDIEQQDFSYFIKSRAGEWYTFDTNPSGNGPLISLAEQQDNKGHSLFFLAVSQGMTELTDLLLKKSPSFSVNSPFTGEHDQKRHPLSFAVEAGYESIVRLLLADKRTDVNIQDNLGESPLYCAVEVGNESMARLLVRKGADVNLQNQIGQSPLHLATKNGHKNVANHLLKKGASVDLQDMQGRTPLDLAAEQGHENMVDLLRNWRSDRHNRHADTLPPTRRARHF